MRLERRVPIPLVNYRWVDRVTDIRRLLVISQAGLPRSLGPKRLLTAFSRVFHHGHTDTLCYNQLQGRTPVVCLSDHANPPVRDRPLSTLAPGSSFTVRPPVSFPCPTSPSNSFHSVALRYGTYLWNCLTSHEPVCAHVEQGTVPASCPSCPRPPTIQVLKMLRCSDTGCSARVWFSSFISSSRRTSGSALLPLLLLEGMNCKANEHHT